MLNLFFVLPIYFSLKVATHIFVLISNIFFFFSILNMNTIAINASL
jgi:hypothetical protein